MSQKTRSFWISGATIAILITYYLATTLPHEIFGAWLNDLLLSSFDRPAYENLWLGVTLACLTVYLFLLFRSKPKAVPVPFLLWCLLLTIVAWNTLFVTNIEMIHLIQYALLAMIIASLVKDLMLTLIWCAILGGIDEAYQYLVLAPETSLYYDFNDVLINILGSGYGLIFYLTHSTTVPARFRIITLISIIAFTIVLVIGFLIQFWCVDGPGCPIVLLKEPVSGFWQSVPPDLSFHQMRPLEGSLIIAFVLISFSWFLRDRKKAAQHDAAQPEFL